MPTLGESRAECRKCIFNIAVDRKEGVMEEEEEEETIPDVEHRIPNPLTGHFLRLVMATINCQLIRL